MVVARSAIKDICCFVYTFSDICRTLGVRNVLQSTESSIQVYRPAKYTTLPVQHTRTQKECFPSLILCAKISNLPSKYGKASSIASECGGVHLYSFHNK